jgi:hypothetical protein
MHVCGCRIYFVPIVFPGFINWWRAGEIYPNGTGLPGGEGAPPEKHDGSCNGSRAHVIPSCQRGAEAAASLAAALTEIYLCGVLFLSRNVETQRPRPGYGQCAQTQTCPRGACLYNIFDVRPTSPSGLPSHVVVQIPI